MPEERTQQLRHKRPKNLNKTVGGRSRSTPVKFGQAHIFSWNVRDRPTRRAPRSQVAPRGFQACRRGPRLACCRRSSRARECWPQLGPKVLRGMMLMAHMLEGGAMFLEKIARHRRLIVAVLRLCTQCVARQGARLCLARVGGAGNTALVPAANCLPGLARRLVSSCVEILKADLAPTCGSPCGFGCTCSGIWWAMRGQAVQKPQHVQPSPAS